MKCKKAKSNPHENELEAAVRDLLYQYIEKYEFCEKDCDIDYMQKLKALLHKQKKL